MAKSVLAGICGAALLVLPVSVNAFGFRGAEIGMTLSAWKSLPPPEQLTGKGVAYCSDDPAESAKPSFAKLGSDIPDEVKCIYADAEGNGVFQRIGMLSTRPFYHFYKGQLYSIELSANALSNSDILRSMRDKYGPPAKTETGVFQTQSGSTFPQVTTTWGQGKQVIMVTAPDDRVDSMTVKIFDGEAMQSVLDARRAMDPSAYKF